MRWLYKVDTSTECRVNPTVLHFYNEDYIEHRVCLHKNSGRACQDFEPGWRLRLKQWLKKGGGK
jgi:hypothetical protein